MNIEKTKEILLGRINKLTEEEKEWMYKNNRAWYNTYLFDSPYQKEEYSNSQWEAMWLWSSFGQDYLRKQIFGKEVSIFGEEDESSHGYDGRS